MLEKLINVNDKYLVHIVDDNIWELREIVKTVYSISQMFLLLLIYFHDFFSN